MSNLELLPNTTMFKYDYDNSYYRIGKHNDCEMCDMYGIWSNDDVGTYYVNNNWDRVKRQRIQKNDKYSDILKLPCPTCLRNILDWKWEFNDLSDESLGRDLRTGFLHTKESFCIELLEMYENERNEINNLMDIDIDTIVNTLVPYELIDYFYLISAYPPWEASEDETCSSECSDGEDSF